MTPAGRGHWLSATGGKINYRESLVSQPDARTGVDPLILIVRSTMDQRSPHPGGNLAQRTLAMPPGRIEKSG